MLFNVTFNNIVPVTLLIGGGNQSTWRKPLTYHKSLDINLIQSLVPYKENIWSYMCLLKTEEISQYHVHSVGSNQFLSVNISIIRLLSVITTPSSKNNVSLINTRPSFRH
jgi:hypothetical protein